jgi:hypothetical protein
MRLTEAQWGKIKDLIPGGKRRADKEAGPGGVKEMPLKELSGYRRRGRSGGFSQRFNERGGD